jgi:HPt (histidine-containing phosphotransfer) domain-containing protein
MDDLYAKFLPQFVKLARARVATAITVASQRDQGAMATVVRELHTLAGEAGLLGLSDVVPLARACEQKAKVLRSSSAAADGDELIVALRQLERTIDSIATTLPV